MITRFQTIDLTKDINFDEVFNFVWNNGRIIRDNYREFEGIVCHIPDNEAGYVKIIWRGNIQYLAAWHCRSVRVDVPGVEGWDIKVSEADNYAKNILNRLTNNRANNSAATTREVNVNIDVINNIIKYCEDKQIYDKLGCYGDFYYKLKHIVEND